MKQQRPVPDAGESAGTRTVQVGDVMTSPVLTAAPDEPVARVRALMAEGGFNSVPIVNEAFEPIGMVTATDLLELESDDVSVGEIMTPNVYTVPQYSGVQIAARIMRNHKIHHVVVTHEKRVAGMVSSFDLLALVEDKRFAYKNPTTRGKKGGKRSKKEK